jgi:ElaB/YqjD/DUF883 family membrane-anchored ribosome-binding protein
MPKTETVSLGGLLSQLHKSILDLTKNLDQLIDSDSRHSKAEIQELREHIRARLVRKEDELDNKKLLELLDLFATNDAAMRIIREDADEWLEFIEALEYRLKQGEAATSEMKTEVREISRLTSEIKDTLRDKDIEEW